MNAFYTAKNLTKLPDMITLFRKGQKQSISNISTSNSVGIL